MSLKDKNILVQDFLWLDGVQFIFHFDFQWHIKISCVCLCEYIFIDLEKSIGCHLFPTISLEVLLQGIVHQTCRIWPHRSHTSPLPNRSFPSLKSS